MSEAYFESDLLFRFPATWVVRKFDETTAYQSLSGFGLKGVDFIALTPTGELWLLEVKNYRPRFKDSFEYRAKRRRPEVLAAQVAGKFTDSQRLLRIVSKSLRKRWWFPLWRSFRAVFPNAKSNYWFWTEAHRRCSEPERVVYVLWLETPETNDDYDVAVQQELKALLPAGVRLYVMERKNTQGTPITATEK